MEKRGLLCAVAMSAVQDLHAPALHTKEAFQAHSRALEEHHWGDGAAGTGSGARAGVRGSRGQRRGLRRRGQSSTPPPPPPKPQAAPAALAVGSMMEAASRCTDTEEIFKALEGVLAAARAEAQQDLEDFVPLFVNAGSRSSSSSSITMAPQGTGKSGSSGSGGGGGSSSLTRPHSSSASPSHRSSFHANSPLLSGGSPHPTGYTMPFGLPPHPPRPSTTRYSGEGAPSLPLLPQATSLGSNNLGPGGSGDGYGAGNSGGGGGTPGSPPPSGSILVALPVAGRGVAGAGGCVTWVTVEAWALSRLALHRSRVEGERLRLAGAMAGLDAGASRSWRHWRRVSRLAEAELEAGLSEMETRVSDLLGGGGDNDKKNSSSSSSNSGKARGKRGGEGAGRLTGIYRDCQWKLATNEHVGHPPGRFRVVLQPVLDSEM
ncbi:unnamed protein product, partial [Discosporangium mesarthrocarpum]